MIKRLLIAAAFFLFATPAAGSELELWGYGLDLLSVTEPRGGPLNPNNAARIAAINNEAALGIEGSWERLSFRLRATLLKGWKPADSANGDFAVQELNRVFAIGDDVRLSVGKRLLSWDVGFAAQPLGFFQKRPVLRDITDEFGRSEGVPLVAVTWLGESAWTTLVYSDDFENEADGFNQGLRQWALNVGYDFPNLTVSGVLQQPLDQRLGFGGSVSGVVSDEIALHGSFFTREGTRRPIHQSIATGRMLFFEENPYASFRVRDRGRYPRWVIGGRWTPDAFTEFLVEWSHDERGLSSGEWRRFQDLIRIHQDGATLGIPQAVIVGNLLFDSQTLIPTGARQDYLFIRVSHQLEDIALAGSGFINLADRSFVPAITLDYHGWRDWSAHLRASAFVGNSASEFGLSPLEWTLSTGLRYAF